MRLQNTKTFIQKTNSLLDHMMMASLPSYKNVDEVDHGKSDISAMFDITISNVIESMKNSAFNQSLSPNYEPNEYDVLCGRGKGYYNTPGNRKFREILIECLPRYISLSTRIEKSIYLNEIIEIVQKRSNGQAKFIRLTKQGNWEVLSDDQAREKVGHAIREVKEPRYKMKSSDSKRNLKQTKAATNSCPKSMSNIETTDSKISIDFKETKVRSFFQPQQNDVSLGISDDDDLFKPLPITSGLSDMHFSNLDLLLHTTDYSDHSVDSAGSSAISVV
jgi:hypothetical protein